VYFSMWRTSSDYRELLPDQVSWSRGGVGTHHFTLRTSLFIICPYLRHALVHGCAPTSSAFAFENPGQHGLAREFHLFLVILDQYQILNSPSEQGIWYLGGALGHSRYYSRSIALSIKAGTIGEPLSICLDNQATC
jgi:hypothetical protein